MDMQFVPAVRVSQPRHTVRLLRGGLLGKGYQVTDQTKEDANSVSEPGENAFPEKMATAATGTASASLQGYRLKQVYGTVAPGQPPLNHYDAKVAAVQTMAEIAPRNTIEAMLAAHMVAVNDASMEAFKRAAHAREYPQCDDRDMRQALRLSATFIRQVEALEKVRKSEVFDSKPKSCDCKPNPIALMTPEERRQKLTELIRNALAEAPVRLAKKSSEE